MSSLTGLSIVIPRFQTPLHLVQRCLKSLEVLQEFIPQLEVILVDSGPDFLNTDQLSSIILRHEKLSSPVFAGEARNRGVDHANFEWIYFIDSDVVLDEKSAQNLAGLVKQMTIDHVLSGPLLIEESAKLFRKIFHCWEFHEFLEQAPKNIRFFCSCHLLLSKSLFLRAGKFNAQLQSGEDFLLGRKLTQLGAQFIFDRSFSAIHQNDSSGELELLQKAHRFGKQRRQSDSSTQEFSNGMIPWLARFPALLALIFTSLILIRIGKASPSFRTWALRNWTGFYRLSREWAEGVNESFYRPQSSSNR